MTTEEARRTEVLACPRCGSVMPMENRRVHTCDPRFRPAEDAP